MKDVWDQHLGDEFSTKNAEAALDTMVPNAYVNHVPVLTGGVGRDQLKDFYSKHFIPNMPADTKAYSESQTVLAPEKW
jgi:carboxymethylenebutenolidase